jgi:hypothetical protein
MSLMWRAVTAAFLLFALFSTSYAQRGGGHGFAGGGAHGFGGGGAHGFGAARPSGGFRSAPMRMGGFAGASRASFAPRQFGFGPRFSPVTRSNFARSRPLATRNFPQRRGGVTFGHITRGSSFRSSFRGRDDRDFRGRGDRDFDRDDFHHRFRNAFLYAFPYYYSGAYLDPFYDDYWNPYYSLGSYGYDPNQGTSTYADLGNQLNQMSLQLDELRDQNESLQSELVESRAPTPPPAIASGASSAPVTVLVFNDGHQRQIQNYAIVGQTLWILSDARATKVPLADLNLDQTIKTNEERGVEFLGPASRQ